MASIFLPVTWPGRRADNRIVLASGFDSGTLMDAKHFLLLGQQQRHFQHPARALQEFLCFVILGFQSAGFSSRPLQYKDVPGKL